MGPRIDLWVTPEETESSHEASPSRTTHWVLPIRRIQSIQVSCPEHHVLEVCIEAVDGTEVQ